MHSKKTGVKMGNKSRYERNYCFISINLSRFFYLLRKFCPYVGYKRIIYLKFREIKYTLISIPIDIR